MALWYTGIDNATQQRGQMERVNKINAIVKDYRAAKIAEWESGNLDWNITELDSAVSDYLEQVIFFWSDEKIEEFFNLIEK